MSLLAIGVLILGFCGEAARPADVTCVSLWGRRPVRKLIRLERKLTTKGGRAATRIVLWNFTQTCTFAFDVSIL